MITIKKYSDENTFRKETGYKEGLNLFFTTSYMNYCTFRHSNNKSFFLLASNDFVVPILIRKYGPFVYASLESEPCQYSDQGEALEDFVNAICFYLHKKEKVKWIPQSQITSFWNAYPDGAKVIRFGSYVVDLKKTEEELFSLLDGSFRKGIRRAEKGEVIIKIGGQELIPDFCVIETEMWKRSGIYIDHKTDTFYPDLFQTMGENVAVGIAYKNDCPQVGLVVYYNSEAAYCMLGGRILKNEPGSNHLLHWKMIQHMKSIGVKEYVVVGYRLKVEEGSKLYNIQKFKDDFGAELRTGYMFKITFSEFYKRLYELLMSILKAIKTRKLSTHKKLDIIDQELNKWPEYNN